MRQEELELNKMGGAIVQDPNTLLHLEEKCNNVAFGDHNNQNEILQAKEEAYKLKKEEEEKEFNDLYESFFGVPKEEEVSSSTKAAADFKETLFKQGSLCKGKESCTETDALLKVEELMTSKAAEATADTLTNCKETAEACETKAKEEAEKRLGQTLDALAFREIKEAATTAKVHTEIATVMEAVLKDSGGNDDKAVQLAETKLRDAVRSGIAAVERGKPKEVTDREINNYLEKIQLDATLNAAQAAGAKASPVAKRLQIKQALRKVGKVSIDDEDVATFQNKALERKMEKVFSKGSACENSKKACIDAAQEQAYAILGRRIKTVELHRLRQKGAEMAAANLNTNCQAQDLSQQECELKSLEKLKAITGNKKLNKIRMKTMITRGVQANAATDMEECRRAGNSPSSCESRVAKSMAHSMGKENVSPSQAKTMIRKGVFNSMKRKLAACLEVATTDDDKNSCRGASTITKMQAYLSESMGTQRRDAAAREEIKREVDQIAFSEAASAAHRDAFDKLPPDATESQVLDAELESERLLKQEMQREVGISLDQNNYLFQQLKENVRGAHVSTLAMACADLKEEELQENCKFEDDLQQSGLSFERTTKSSGYRTLRALSSREVGEQSRKTRIDHKLRRDAMKTALMDELKSCTEVATTTNVQTCVQSASARAMAKVLRGSLTYFANDLRDAATSMATQKMIDCIAGNGKTRTCQALAKLDFKRLTEGDAQRETFESASIRRVRDILTLCPEEDTECSSSALSLIKVFGYEAHEVQATFLQHAKSAAAEAWADGIADEESEENKLKMARSRFGMFAPLNLFDMKGDYVDTNTGLQTYPTRTAILSLALAKSNGKATQVVRNESEVVSILSLKSACDKDRLEKVRTLISIAAGGAETVLISSGEGEAGKADCQSIYRTHVKAGSAKLMSKTISDKVSVEVRRMRRLGSSSGAGGKLSSSVHEEEVPFGTVPKYSHWDAASAGSEAGGESGSEAGSETEDEENYNLGFGRLSSAGYRLNPMSLVSMCVCVLVAAFSLLQLF